MCEGCSLELGGPEAHMSPALTSLPPSLGATLVFGRTGTALRAGEGWGPTQGGESQ